MITIIFAILLSFLICSITGLILIPLFNKLKLGQNIKKEAPKSHNKKAGTPTFGGIIFIFSSIITMLIFIENCNKEFLIVLSAFLAFGIIGFIDDFLKKKHKKNEGLTPIEKMVLLLFVSTIFAFYSYYNSSIGSLIIIPFTKKSFDLGILYIPFIIFYYVSTTNAVNLTDGIDGLATSITLLIITFFIFISFNMGYYSLSIFCGCVAGSLLGFLKYNSYPAKIIMGDTGSLALGGVVATVAMILKNPLILIIVGGIYVIETLSVIIQIASFKLLKKRVFKMAPIHHSFELCGWHETKIVLVFSIITTILCLIGFLSF
ncbi:phospho-N-acetylmuramoyl-pentapeptide-transferase [Haloimpatiens massiliensis]|uniref:phospho-N-acetylmuramoyl-pentapeptide- transferase n=1 Tax=Haloimpatiens massiliensis TaxID=1658110 RepID=UPI000C85CB92|nr:phospho-N-acetylmuramoyl-pentapeptide-transferase [Haloimpatiens massiliensis]